MDTCGLSAALHLGSGTVHGTVGVGSADTNEQTSTNVAWRTTEARGPERHPLRGVYGVGWQRVPSAWVAPAASLPERRGSLRPARTIGRVP